jgi:lipoprotein-releasing system ATP-binding protein
MGLTVENLTKEYRTRSGSLSVLAGINLALESGDALAVMGPSGSGKSTLLHILGTLDNPSGGIVRLDEVDPFTLPEPELAAFRNQRIGFIFQDHHLLPQCSVLENVVVPALVASERERAVARSDARHLLERVGLGGRLDHRPAELSGGERQRAAIARALIRKPKLLLADEPTGNLDRKTAQAVGELLADVQRQERTILVLVTHSPELARLFPRRAEMTEGRLEARD